MSSQLLYLLIPSLSGEIACCLKNLSDEIFRIFSLKTTCRSIVQCKIVQYKDHMYHM